MEMRLFHFDCQADPHLIHFIYPANSKMFTRRSLF